MAGNKILKPTIGLEIHTELRTDSKMFCGCSAYHFGVKANTLTCPVCLGLPGALPKPNSKALEWTVKIGLALNCKISGFSKFDRKHYFYPDLAKSYQISQYDKPLCTGGFLETSYGTVGITRVHLEEDTGKLIHKKIDGRDVSLIDFNRSGVPLVEIVTEPDIHSGPQAKEFAQKLQQIIRYLEVSDADMEKGSMRLEANISLGLSLGYKVEVKNLNSFRFVEKAIEYELERQRGILMKGETPRQETRGWNEAKGITYTQRYKETAADYRYFPEPDIPPMEFNQDYISDLKKSLPELPGDVLNNLTKNFGIRKEYAEILLTDRALTSFSIKAVELGKKAGLKENDIVGFIVNSKVDYKSVSPEKVIEKVQKQKTSKVSDSETIEKWVNETINAHPEVVADYKKGKLNAIAVLIGNVMKLSAGKADAPAVRDLMERKLSE